VCSPRLVKAYNYSYKRYRGRWSDREYEAQQQAENTVNAKCVWKIRAATQYLLEKGCEKIGIMGFGYGSAIGLISLMRNPAFSAGKGI
jgi:dienelactone hydrolase